MEPTHNGDPLRPPPDDRYHPEEFNTGMMEDSYRLQDPVQEEPPIEDPNFKGSLLAGILKTAGRLITSPVIFFQGMKEDRSVMPSMIWILTILCICFGMEMVVGLFFQEAYMESMAELLKQFQPGFDEAQFRQTLEWTQSFGIVFQIAFIPIFAVFQYFRMAQF